MLTAEKCVADINDVLGNYGVIPYYDKGPFELMDIDSHASAIRTMTAAAAAEVLAQVLKFEHGEPFVRSVLISLDDWDQFDTMLDKNNDLADVY